MADNLKILKQNLDNAIDPNAGVGGILVQEHNDVFTEFINKSGKYTGFTYKSVKESNNNIFPVGILSWNSNSFNDINEFTITLSQLTKDLNDIGHILDFMNVDSIIHFKDYVGRSVILKYINHSQGTDDNSNIIYNVVVKGVIDNTNYTYQVNEEEDCVIDFYLKVNSPKNIAIASDLIIPPIQNNWTYNIKANLTLTLGSNLDANFRMTAETNGGQLTIAADVGCTLIHQNVTVPTAVLQDLKTLAIYRINQTNNFIITGDID